VENKEGLIGGTQTPRLLKASEDDSVNIARTQEIILVEVQNPKDTDPLLSWNIAVDKDKRETLVVWVRLQIPQPL